MEPNDILKRPYARVLTPEPDGQYTAEIMEFPGCVAYGDNAAAALANLELVALDWITAVMEQGQNIPDPLDSAEYSGKLVLRMPRGLHGRAALFAEREGVSLNQFIVTCLAEAVGERARPQVIYAQPMLQTNFGVQVSATTVAFTTLPVEPQVGTRQMTTANFGPIVLPQWRRLEREHA